MVAGIHATWPRILEMITTAISTMTAPTMSIWFYRLSLTRR